ncbi:MAG: hypothetical protein AAF581_03370 [Planctomycetota bacterium]
MSDRPKKPEQLPGDVCSCLMTKTMQLNTHHRRSAFEEHFTADTALFHCLCTMDCQGPDGDDVEPEKCRPGRACYEGGIHME